MLGAANDANVAISLIKNIAPTERFMNFADGWFSAVRRVELVEIDRHLNGLQGLEPLRLQNARARIKKTS
jgi:hypothetical protein